MLNSYDTQSVMSRITLEGILTFWLLASLYVALYFGRKFSARVSNISQTLEDFAEGNRDANLIIRGSDDEIDALTKAVNETLRRIQQDIAASNRVNGSLSHQLIAPIRRVRDISESLVVRIKKIYNEERSKGSKNGLAWLRLSEELDQAATELRHVVRTGEGLQNLLSAGRKRLKSELNQMVDLCEVCDVAATRFRQKAAQRNIKLGVVGDTIEVRTSAYAVEQIVSNLIDNAIIYGPSDSQVVVYCNRSEAGVVIGVRDAGDGPPKHVIADVFGQCIVAETTPTGRFGSGGHGIGLLTIRQLADNCGMILRQYRTNDRDWCVEICWP